MLSTPSTLSMLSTKKQNLYNTMMMTMMMTLLSTLFFAVFSSSSNGLRGSWHPMSLALFVAEGTVMMNIMPLPVIGHTCTDMLAFTTSTSISVPVATATSIFTNTTKITLVAVALPLTALVEVTHFWCICTWHVSFPS
jgi:hypothetical protein